MIEYSLEAPHTLKEYFQGNLERHVADIKDKSLYAETCVNWELYEEMSREGLCYAAIARENGDIVGYNIYILTADWNKNDEVMASDVAMFIEKKYRGRLIIDFITQCDMLLRRIEVKRVIRSFCDERLGKILDKAGYMPRSITKSKTL